VISVLAVIFSVRFAQAAILTAPKSGDVDSFLLFHALVLLAVSVAASVFGYRLSLRRLSAK
jgi:hypothetical protein